MSALGQGFLDAMAAERGAAKNTLESYRRDLGVYEDFLKDRGRTRWRRATRISALCRRKVRGMA